MRPPLSQVKEFRVIKNAVIREAERIRCGVVSFEDDGIQQDDEPEEFTNSSYSATGEDWNVLGGGRPPGSSGGVLPGTDYRP